MRDTLKPGIDKRNTLEDGESVRYRLEVKPYTVKEMYQLYQLSYKAFRTSIKPILELLHRPGRFFSVKQVELIFNHLGLPAYLIEGK